MSFGIGLGAFMDGFERGSAMRERIDMRNEMKKNKAALDGIESETKAQFDAQVKEGSQSPQDYDQFWKNYALPRRKNEMLRQGDVAGARQLEDWGNSDAALQGGRLFSSSLLKLQTGDFDGALNDAIKAGQVKGYIDHGYELAGHDKLVNQQGELLGYQFRVKGADGKMYKEDVPTGKLGQMIAVFANPDAAWQSHVAGRDAEKKRKDGLTEYEDKKKLDQKYKSSPNNSDRYSKAREARAKNDLSFGELPEAEQDQRVRQDLDAADRYAADRDRDAAPSATPQPARKQIIVDEATGAPVSPVGMDRQPGLGVQPGAAPPKAAPNPAAGKQDAINNAAAYMLQGGNPEYIAQQLLNAGVAEGEWPEPVRQAMQQKAQSGAIGLGR